MAKLKLKECNNQISRDLLTAHDILNNLDSETLIDGKNIRDILQVEDMLGSIETAAIQINENYRRIYERD